MENNFNQELNKINYLFNYSRGLVISEQVTTSGNTSGGTTSTGSTVTDKEVTRLCSDYKSTDLGLTKSITVNGYDIYNDKNGKPFCKKKIEPITEESDIEPVNQGFKVEPNVRFQPREKEIQGIFGKYDEIIPNDILRYMRKNPQLVMNRLAKIYGEKFLDYAEKAYVKVNWKDENNID